MFFISFHHLFSSALGRVLLVIHVESRQADLSKEEAFGRASWQMQRESLPSVKGSWQADQRQEWRKRETE